ncbi:hypothetical protein [uncultured Chitinophaga sp.]|uniref:hypothetical protein n=1 Tax=uncultured Chitinophaga sp. TaxID=339340 RepID=UPI0025F0AAF6|nr:hypothetical protein [uncultured Chitinophaga sp.]
MMYKDQINYFLLNKLQAAHCVKGILDYQLTAGAIMALRGEKEDGGSVYFWELELELRRHLANYMEQEAPQAKALEIEIDVKAETFKYRDFSAMALKLLAKEDGRADLLARQQQLRQVDNAAYGYSLATRVADALDHGSLMHSHRDYCGMGLEKSKDGDYLYGEVWDGYLTPSQIFSDKITFIRWLAEQSDASMANLNSEDFYSNNQVINRLRLEAFVI